MRTQVRSAPIRSPRDRVPQPVVALEATNLPYSPPSLSLSDQQTSVDDAHLIVHSPRVSTALRTSSSPHPCPLPALLCPQCRECAMRSTRSRVGQPETCRGNDVQEGIDLSRKPHAACGSFPSISLESNTCAQIKTTRRCCICHRVVSSPKTVCM